MTMARFPDWETAPEVADIMEQLASRFETVFHGLEVECIDFVMTKVKKLKDKALKLHSRGYPDILFHEEKPYIVEAFDKNWGAMTQKQRNLAVFHVMCAIPAGGMDPKSKFYAKKARPDIQMFTLEFAASGGVPNWRENPLAADPMERTADDLAANLPASSPDSDPIPASEKGVQRMPVTADDVANAAS